MIIIIIIIIIIIQFFLSKDGASVFCSDCAFAYKKYDISISLERNLSFLIINFSKLQDHLLRAVVEFTSKMKFSRKKNS